MDGTLEKGRRYTYVSYRHCLECVDLFLEGGMFVGIAHASINTHCGTNKANAYALLSSLFGLAFLRSSHSGART